MKNYLSQIAQKVQPYTWEFGDGIRFNSNTVPFPPKSLQSFLKDMQKDCPINEYADPNYTDLKKLLANYENVSVEMLTITNSGDEAIDILAKTFLNPDEYFITTPPTYEMFAIQSEINKGIRIEIPLQKETWEVNAEKIIIASKNTKTKLIFLCNPNNPTGAIVPENIVEEIVKRSDAIVVIDETYREFYGKSSVSLLKKYDNIVILRSFSKFAGIAGARIGYVITNKNLSEKFNGIRFPMGVSFFSYKLAECVLKKDQKWIQEQMKIIKTERTRLDKFFTDLNWKVYPSQTNFLLVNIGKNAKKVCLQLKEKGILIRDRSDKKYLEGCVRITIRSPKENTILINALRNILRFTQDDKRDSGRVPVQSLARMTKVAFLDRDGTLIFEPQDTFQIDSIEKLKILDGVIKGLKNLIGQGYQLMMITNQDGLGTRSFSQKKFDKPQKKFIQILKENDIRFTNIFVCPHVASENCDCRKPKIGLVKNFLINNTIDKNNSFVCGDRETDNMFAKNIGVKFIPMKTNSNFYTALVEGGVMSES